MSEPEETFKRVAVKLVDGGPGVLRLNKNGEVLAVLTPEYEEQLIDKIVRAMVRRRERP